MLEEYNADLLTNIRVEEKLYPFFYWNSYVYNISADVWRSKNNNNLIKQKHISNIKKPSSTELFTKTLKKIEKNKIGF